MQWKPILLEGLKREAKMDRSIRIDTSGDGIWKIISESCPLPEESKKRMCVEGSNLQTPVEYYRCRYCMGLIKYALNGKDKSINCTLK